MSTIQTADDADLFAVNMTRVIRSLMAREGITAGQIQTLANIPPNTWAVRMRRANWRAQELAAVADILSCGPGDLFADPEAIGVRQNWKILNPVPFDGDHDDPTPPVRGHLTPVP